jgi:GT2 family glycosyltransferase/glycosyltransferase involved in cell wall biosynthesis
VSEIDRVRATLFDEQWYRNGGPPFAGDAYEHFAGVGWRLGRNPHPLFDLAYYLRQAPDLAGGDENPLEHYDRVGSSLGLDPHPLFDTAFYLARHEKLVGSMNPLAHYLQTGARSGLDPNIYFVSSYYLELGPDVAAGGENPLVHYAAFGGQELHRRPHPLFDPRSYARRHKLEPGTNPLVHLLERLRALRSQPPAVAPNPEVSAIILNLNKSLLTTECVLELLDPPGAIPLEVVVVDNGSQPADFEQLATTLPGGVKLVRLATNRFFGEGNNVGVDAASGRLLLFVNNDAFVSSAALAALKAVLDRYPDVGAVGAKLVYPDGRLQECGAMVSSCGTVTQRGKLLDDQPGRFAKTERVDYVSAACLMLPRSDFDEVGGFDLAWDPAYYEDVDLCLKLALLEKPTYYCPQAVVTHIENATSNDQSLGMRLNTVVEVNREKFIARWGDYLERRERSAAHVTLPPRLLDSPAFAGTAVLYTPYALVPGGGERYLLTIAQALARRYRTYLLTPELYSSFRLRTLASDLGLDLSGVRLEHVSEIARLAGCDVFVALGNEALPPVRAVGSRSIFVCQFPFPMHPNHVAGQWGTLESYDDVVVYSQFAAGHFRTRAGQLSRRVPRLTVLPPPSPMYDDVGPAARVPGRILNVGRFAPGGHCKRQDTLVDAFRRLVRASHRDDLELHLVGTVSAAPDSREFYSDVHRRAQGLPVYFHLSAPPQIVSDLYATSSSYWHATGYGSSEVLFPERMEHFGISIVEGMSAGCIPLVYAVAGPAEIVRHGVTGYHWLTLDDLVKTNLRLLAASDQENRTMRERARAAAREYDAASFERRLSALLGVAAGGDFVLG